jgi:GT2 family glycosyltransferase
VDNAPCTSATADLIRQCRGHPAQVHYVREDRPGLPWARNCGLRRARGEIVAYTDDDALADPHWLSEIAQAFLATDNVVCVTGLALPAELETQAQAWFEQFGGFNKGRGFDRLIFNMTTHRRQDPLYPYLAGQFGAGVNMAFTASALRALGGFDPAFVKGQDIELYFRIIAAGYTLVYEPAALVHHFHRRDYASLRTQLLNYGTAFTAFLSKCLTDDPKRLFYLLGRLPSALSYLFSSRSVRNEHKTSYPQELTWLELLGMLRGPIWYLLQRWNTYLIVKQFGPLQVK